MNTCVGSRSIVVRYGKLSVEMSAALRAVADGEPYGGITAHRFKIGRSHSLGALVRHGVLEIDYCGDYKITQHGRGLMMQRREVLL